MLTDLARPRVGDAPSARRGGASAGACRYPKRHPGEGRDPVRRAARVLFAASFLALTPARAVEPGEVLKDPALEARARHLSQELRCLVCQNQSIDDSNAELARDLRVLVRERLAAGDTDAAVLAFVEARYGEFVLLRPRLRPHTILLWLTPLMLLAGTAILILRRARTRARTAAADTTPLSPDEQRRLDRLLSKES